MDFLAQLAEMALGSRLKRLSDQFRLDTGQFYVEHGLDFEPRWYPVFRYLSQYEQAEVTQVAMALGVSHAAISHLAKEMEKHGWIKSQKSKQDLRKRILQLTDKGRNALPQLQTIWNAVSRTNLELLQAQRNNLLFAIEEMEQLLAQKSALARQQHFFKLAQQQNVEILDFQPQYQADFKRLNIAWIQKYFRVEPHDEEQLDDPKTHILADGGRILLARVDGKIVGACALCFVSDGIYEMAKMAVDEAYQGRQIGKKLGIAIVELAQSLGARELMLDTNSQLVTAITLYQTLGFKKESFSETPYERADVRMRLFF
jgi:DNA-binding MarR family transcriptional regulator/GNAT superfamily N-acetyltransferase